MDQQNFIENLLNLANEIANEIENEIANEIANEIENLSILYNNTTKCLSYFLIK